MQQGLLWFLPAALRSGERDDLRRALLCVAGCWIGVAIAALIGATQAAWGIWQSAAAAFACGAGCALLPFWLRRTGNWRAVGRILCALVWAAPFGVALLTGGRMLSALYYLTLSPALAAMILGIRSAIVPAVASMLAVAGLYALNVAGAAFPVAVSTEVGMRAAMRGALILNFALALLVGAYEWLRSGMLRDSARSERRYRALAEHGPDLIAEVDARGRILDMTAAAGTPVAALVGRVAVEAIHRDDQPLLAAAVQQLESQPSVHVGPLRWLASRSEIYWFELSLTRLESRPDARLLVVARDVSDRVALEAKLRQSQKMQAVGELASGLAHDFNNLLMVISGYAEVLAARAAGDPQAQGAIAEIERASDQGAALTRRLVALSRPSAIERRALDLNAAVRESERVLRMLLGGSIALRLDVAPGELCVDADPGELEQILVNLVANARDALPGGGNVLIATGTSGERVQLIVSDDGSGIEASELERIFEPFFTTKRASHGAGLGLYVVYSIVSGLGGEIRVESEVGSGTRFCVELPASHAPRLDAAPARRTPAAAIGGDERILVVEDRPELRNLIREALERVGYRVIAAADGLEALALDLSEGIDLVLTDIVMPRMGGLALVAALREKRPDLRALFVSGQLQHVPDEVRIDPRDRLLRKPFLIQDLRRAVREALDSV